MAKSAHAQGWLADRKYAEGIGVKVGNFELHPGVGGEAGFDSNYLRRTYNAGASNSDPAVAGIFRITPSLYLSTLGPERKQTDQNAEPPTVNFRAGISATYRAFLGDKVITDLNGLNGLSADVNGRLDVLPQRPWSFGLEAGYDRTVAPNSAGNPDVNFNRNTLNAGADVTWSPGGGLLSWKLGYRGRFTFLDASGTNPFNNISNAIITQGSWKFRPKTAVVYDGNFAFNNFTQRAQAFNGLLDSTPLRSRLGLSGLISPRFGLLAMVGYGGSFVDTQGNAAVQQYDSVIGQLEAKFFLTPNPNVEAMSDATLSISSLSIGYNRDFATSYLGSYYGSDRGYLKMSYFFAGRALVSLEGGFGAREYPRLFSNTGSGLATISEPFVNGAADATIFAEYRFSNTLGLNTTLRYTEEMRFSNAGVLPAGGTGPGPNTYDMAYRRFEAYLGFRWFM